MKTTILLLLSLSPIAALAQETFFSESLEVRIIDVDVIVTDKKGNPVSGLTKDDFEIVENGAPKEISNFYEYRGLPTGPGVKQPTTTATPVAADLRPRRIILFIDDESLNAVNRNRVFPAMKELVKSSLRPGDAVMIARWKPGLEFSLELTGDANAAVAKLDELASAASQGTAKRADLNTSRDQMLAAAIAGQKRFRDQDIKPPIDDGIERARMYAMRMLHEQHRKTEAIRSLLGSLRGIDGRKILVLLSESLSEQPGRAAFDFLYSIRDQYAGGEGFVPDVNAAEFADERLVPMISEAANSAGVTLYPVDAGGLGAMFDDISPEAGGSQARSIGDRKESSDAKVAALRGIAAATGGVASTLSNNFKLAFSTIANDLNSYYSLGYRANAQRQDEVRSIDVRVRRKGYTVRTRNSFVEKSMSSEMADAVAANLFYTVEKNDLKIGMTAGAKNAVDAEHSLVPVELKIPTSSLTLLPDGKNLTGKFSTYAAFVRGDGVVSKVKVQSHQLRFPADSLSRRKEITLKLDVTIDNETDGLSVGVMDDVSRTTGFATVKVAAK